MAMMIRGLLLGLCAAFAGCATQAPLRPVPRTAAPAANLAEVEALTAQAEQDGVAIFVLDRAAWVASDVVKPLPGSDRIRGWVTDVDGGNVAVTFFGGVDGRSALYRVTVDSTAKVIGAAEAFDPPHPLTDVQRAQHAAVTLARSTEVRHCGGAYNSVAVARPSAGLPMWSVYVLPAMTEADVVQAGGHHRFEIDASGTHILSQRAFTKTCIALHIDPKAEALALTHLLDPTPTEIHVFISLLARKPLFVAAGRDMWEVGGGHIRFVEGLDRPAK